MLLWFQVREAHELLPLCDHFHIILGFLFFFFISQEWSFAWFGQNQRITRYFRLERTSDGLQSNLLLKIGTALRPARVAQGLSSLILKTSKNTDCLTSLGKLPASQDVKAFSLFPVWTSPVSTYAHCCSSSLAPLWRWHILDVPKAPAGCSLITSKAVSSPHSQLPQPLIVGQVLPPPDHLDVPLMNFTLATPFLFWDSPCWISLNFIRSRLPILPGCSGPSAQQLCPQAHQSLPSFWCRLETWECTLLSPPCRWNENDLTSFKKNNSRGVSLIPDFFLSDSV